MTQVKERPTAAPKRMPERVEIPAPRRGRMFRWLGWLLAIAVVATAATIVAINVTSEDAVETPTAVVTDPNAITADPKVRTPVAEPAVVTESLVEDASIWPGIYWAPRTVESPETTYPEESTVTPGLSEFGG